jgi:hypothetical protein
MTELWRTLRIGDRVRIIEWPDDLRESEVHVETAAFYKWIIDTKAVLEIVRIDECGLPFGEIERDVGGVTHWESVALNHEGIDIVQRATDRKNRTQ